jgi:drug/metabolite transporter (DMT)-like permease
VVWGSTYLAIRVAVGPDGGFPPMWLGAIRTLTAGSLLVLGSAIAGKRARPAAGELALFAAAGVLLWLGGNGLVVFAETRADSGYAALLVAVSPMWVALLDAALDRRAPSALLVASLVVGLGGIATLSAPELRHAGGADPLAVACLLGAGMSWATGLVLQKRRAVEVDPVASAGWQQLAGGVAFAATALIAGEPVPWPGSIAPDAWWALGYLTVFGSLIAFTSFVFAVRLLPNAVVMTYAYVNPVIAVALGAALLDEPITGWTLAGAAMVLVAVAGVFRDRRARA